MGKYTRYPIRSKSKRQMSPIWRGVGCILIVIVPLMSFWLMLLLAPPIIATGLVPYQLLGYIQFPVWVLRNKMIPGGVADLVCHYLTLLYSALSDIWAGALHPGGCTAVETQAEKIHPLIRDRPRGWRCPFRADRF